MTEQDPDPLDRILADVMGARGPAAVPARPLPAFPGFTLLEEVGGGGFGIVYRARDETLQREVALKLLQPQPGADPRAGEKFLEEARALARVRHPHVLAIHGVLEHEGRRALCTEFIDGETLEEVLEEEGPLEVEEAARVGIHLARALGAVHAAGIVHRDVKPANVLRERGGRIVLADFGLGVFRSEDGPGETRSPLAGSPVFMSPEQVIGGALDGRSDLYSLGVLLYHLVSGRFPFEDETLEGLFRKIASARPLPLEEARHDPPRSFGAVVLRALEKDPARRFQDARAMEEALRGFLEERRRPLRAWRRAALLAILAFGLLAGLLAVFKVPPEGDGDGFRIGWSLREERPEGGKRKKARGLRLEVEADREVHVYLLLEERKGRKYLLFPGPGDGSRIDGGSRQAIFEKGLEKGFPPGDDIEEEGGHLVLLASTSPLGPLEDALPERWSKATGKDGLLRLKPMTERGLERLLFDQEGLGEEDGRLLSRGIEALGPSGDLQAASGIWARKIPLSRRG